MASMDVTFKDVELIWKNFSGKADDFNPQGIRQFNIVVNDEMADYLRNIELTTKSGRVVKGANVKTHIPKNGDGDPLLTLRVRFGGYPPEEMWRVVNGGKMRLTMDTVGNLDREYIEKAKVMVSLSAYETGRNVGITAYLKRLIVWVKEDDFANDDDFASLPEIGGGQKAANFVQEEDEDLPF